MPQRVIFVVIHGAPSQFAPQWQQLAAHSLHGTISGGGDPRAVVFSADWLQALAAAKLSRVTIGTDWRDAAPVRSRTLAVFTQDSRWRALPASSEARISTQLEQLTTPLAVAQKLATEEPWDLLGVSLPLPQEVDAFAQELAKFLAAQPADVGTVMMLCGGNDTRWLCHTPGIAPGDGGERPIDDVLITALAWLNVEAPQSLKGARLESSASKPAGYSEQDEKEIQKRLEDLGYL
jgi:hypothetical protein